MGSAGTQSGFHWGHINCNIHKNATGLLNSYQHIGTQSGLQAPKTNKRLKASSKFNGFRWNPKWVPLGTQQLQYPQKCNRWDLDFGTGPHVEGGIPSAQFLLSTAFSASSLHKVLEHAVRLIFPNPTGPFHESCWPEPHLHCMRDNTISWTDNPRQAGGRAQAGRQGWCGCVRALARGRRTWVGRAGGAAGPAEQGERAVAKS